MKRGRNGKNNWQYTYKSDYIGATPLKNPQQELFVQEFLKDNKQTKAAERAGYAPGAPAGRTAYRLLKYDYVQKRVEYLRDQILEVNGITVNYIAQGLKREADFAKESKDRTKALGELAKWRGMFINRHIVEEKPKRIVVRHENGTIAEDFHEG